MRCKHEGCKVTTPRSIAVHWKKDRLCAVHAIMDKPEEYFYLMPKIQALASEILQYSGMDNFDTN